MQEIDPSVQIREHSSFCSPSSKWLDPTSLKPAILQPGLGCFTFGHLSTMFLDLAGALEVAGVSAQDTVAVIQTDGACGLISILGVTRVCACCPVDPALTASELAYDLERIGAAAVIVEGGKQAAVAVGQKLGMAIILATATVPLCRWEQISPATKEIQKHTNGGARLLLHTSATSGYRKLVPLTDGNVEAMLDHTLAITGLNENDRLLLMARHFHIQGIISATAQLVAGGSLIAPRDLAPAALRGALESLEPSWYTCGPTMHRAMLGEIQRSGRALPQSLRFVRCAGAPLTPTLYEELRSTLRVPVLNVYGLSETGGIASTTLDGAAPPGSVGRSMGPEIAILRDRSNNANEEGEIIVRGPAVMHGYVGHPDANRDAFRDGWLRTGDLGRIDANGFLYLGGRIKEIINRGGEKIIPDEIDAVLSQHSAVRDVAAFAVPHETLGDEIACAIVLSEGATASIGELRSFLEGKIAAFKIPRFIVLRDAIPRGSTGKPRRLALRDEYAQIALRIEPTLPIESFPLLEDTQLLFRLWSSLLGCKSIGMEEDFFALGGDSLSAATMLAAIDSLFGLAVPLSSEHFVKNSTVAGLIEMLKHADEVQADQGVAGIVYPMRTEGQRGTFFFIPAADTKGLYLRRVARNMTNTWSSALVRPAERGPFRPLYAIEDAATEAIAAITALQPVGPYILGGYCQGGVIAFQAALQLQRLGQPAFLVLFDTPFPGGVHVLQQWDVYSTHVREKLKRARQTITIKPLVRSGLSLLRRTLWLLLRQMRPLVNRLWGFRWMRELCAWCTRKDFSFYRPREVSLPILHFLAEEDTSRLGAESRLRWARITSGHVTNYWLPGNHGTVFDEANLPILCQVMERWVAKHLDTTGPDTQRIATPAET